MKKEQAMSIVLEDCLELKNLDKFEKDKEIVLSAVQQNGYSLKYADESLKKDKEIVCQPSNKMGIH